MGNSLKNPILSGRFMKKRKRLKKGGGGAWQKKKEVLFLKGGLDTPMGIMKRLVA